MMTSPGEFDWILNSASSSHCCRNIEFFVDLEKVKSSIYVADEESQPMRVEGKGTVILELTNDRVIELKNCFYTPKCRKNIISIIKMDIAGCKGTFKGGKF